MQNLRVEVVAPRMSDDLEMTGIAAAGKTDQQPCAALSSPRLHAVPFTEGQALPVRRGAPAYFGWYEHPAFGRIRARLVVSCIDGQWSGEWEFSGQSGPCRRVMIDPHDGRCVSMKSVAEQQVTELLGRVAKNGTLIGEVIHDGVGDGYFKLSPMEEQQQQQQQKGMQPQPGQVALCNGKFAEASSSEGASDLPPECAICLQHFSAGELISRTACSKRGHVFHTCCVQEWLRSQATCPLCRQSLTSEACKSSDPRHGAPSANAQWSSFA